MPPQCLHNDFSRSHFFQSGRTTIGLSPSRDSRVGVLEVSRRQHRHRVGWDVMGACEGQGATRLAVSMTASSRAGQLSSRAGLGDALRSKGASQSRLRPWRPPLVLRITTVQ